VITARMSYSLSLPHCPPWVLVPATRAGDRRSGKWKRSCEGSSSTLRSTLSERVHPVVKRRMPLARPVATARQHSIDRAFRLSPNQYPAAEIVAAVPSERVAPSSQVSHEHDHAIWHGACALRWVGGPGAEPYAHGATRISMRPACGAWRGPGPGGRFGHHSPALCPWAWPCQVASAVPDHDPCLVPLSRTGGAAAACARALSLVRY